MGHISSPSAQGIPSVFVTFPPGKESLDLTIQWPSGLTTEETILPGENRHFTEPDLVLFEPPSRWIKADGISTAKVRITPLSQGQVVKLFASREGKREEVELSSEENQLVYSWTSSSNPGSVRFEIEVDGVMLGIRPIVFEVPTEDD